MKISQTAAEIWAAEYTISIICVRVRTERKITKITFAGDETTPFAENRSKNRINPRREVE